MNSWTLLANNNSDYMRANGAYLTGGLSSAVSATHAGGMPGTGGKYARGGRWDKDLGRFVLTGEEGPELAVSKDGSVQTLGAAGPEIVVPQRSATVIPNDVLARLQVPKPPALRSSPALTAQKLAATPVAAPARSALVNGLHVPLPAATRTAAQLDAATDKDAPLIDPQVAALARFVPPPPSMREAEQSGAGTDKAAPFDPQMTAAAQAPDVNLPHIGRGRAMLLAALSMARPAVTQAQQNANARGGGVHLSDLAAAATEIGTAGVAGAISPRSVAQMQAEQQRTKLEADRARQQAFELEQAKINQTNAAAGELNARPARDAAKLNEQQARAAAQARAHEQSLLRAEIVTRLKEPRSFDPVGNDYDADLHERATAAGVSFSPGAFGVDTKNPLLIEAIDPTDPSGTKKTKLLYNRTTGELGPLKLKVPLPSSAPTTAPPAVPAATDGAPAAAPALIVPKPSPSLVTGYVQPVGADGLTPAQRAGVTDRRAGQRETQRHNAATESQGTERIGLARAGQALRGQSTAHTDARLAQAAGLNFKLEEEKNKSAHPPKMINGVETTDAYRQGYTERHRQAAAGFAQQIKDAHGDIYETGVDADGWPYAKPKVQPGAGVRAAGGDGATYSEDEVRRRARAAGRDENAAVEAARQHGILH